jgi:hypothetical protein
MEISIMHSLEEIAMLSPSDKNLEESKKRLSPKKFLKTLESQKNPSFGEG